LLEKLKDSLYLRDKEALRAANYPVEPLRWRVFGPRIKYREFAIKFPGALLFLSALYQVIDAFHLFRDVAFSFAILMRSFWLALLQLIHIPDDFQLAEPQLDLLTLGTFGFASYLFADKEQRLKASTVYSMDQLDRSGKWMRRVGIGFYGTIFVLFSAIFWFENAAIKLQSGAGIGTLLSGVLAATIALVLLAIFRSMSELRKQKNEREGILKYTALLALFLYPYQLWYMGFFPHDFVAIADEIGLTVKYYYHGLSHLLMGAFVFLYFKYWVFFRDIIVFAFVLFLTGELVEYAVPHWPEFENELRQYFNIRSLANNT